MLLTEEIKIVYMILSQLYVFSKLHNSKTVVDSENWDHGFFYWFFIFFFELFSVSHEKKSTLFSGKINKLCL